MLSRGEEIIIIIIIIITIIIIIIIIINLKIATTGKTVMKLMLINDNNILNSINNKNLKLKTTTKI